jgi:hypothetical protein
LLAQRRNYSHYPLYEPATLLALRPVRRLVTGAAISAPSVIFLNTVVAGLAVAEFVNLVTNYMGRPYNAQLTYYPLTGEVKPTLYEADLSRDCATGKYTAGGDEQQLPCR